MQQIAITQLTPEDLKALIREQFKLQLESLKKEKEQKSVDPVFTREQTAKRFNVDLSTLYRWTKEGKIVAHAIGARVYYKESSIQEALVKLNTIKSHKL